MFPRCLGKVWNFNCTAERTLSAINLEAVHRASVCWSLSYIRLKFVTQKKNINICIQLKISVGGIPKSKEVCIYKVDIDCRLFFALAVLIFIATWSKHCGKVQMYIFKVQSNFWNLGNRISGTRNLLNTSGSQNPVPRAGSVQTSGTEPNPSELIERRNLRTEPEPWNRKTCHSEPVPGTQLLPRTDAARPERTEVYIAQRPHGILLLGNKFSREETKPRRKNGFMIHLKIFHRNVFSISLKETNAARNWLCFCHWKLAGFDQSVYKGLGASPKDRSM